MGRCSDAANLEEAVVNRVAGRKAGNRAAYREPAEL